MDTLLQPEQPAPPRTPGQHRRRIPRARAAAASFAAAAASALIVCLAVSSSGRRDIIRGPNYSVGAPAHDQMAFFPSGDVDNTIGATTTEQTHYSYPRRRQMRRLEEMAEEDAIDVDQDMDEQGHHCLLYTSPSPRDRTRSRMPSSA